MSISNAVARSPAYGLPQARSEAAHRSRNVGTSWFGPNHAHLSPEALLQHLAGRDFSRLLPGSSDDTAALLRASTLLANDSPQHHSTQVTEQEFGSDSGWAGMSDPGRHLPMRHQEFHSALDLARAYRASGDPKFAEKWNELLESGLAASAIRTSVSTDALVVVRRIENWTLSLQVLLQAQAAQYLDPVVVHDLLQRIGIEIRHVLAHPGNAASIRLAQLRGIIRVAASFPEFSAAGFWLESTLHLLDHTLSPLFDDEGGPAPDAVSAHSLLDLALASLQLAKVAGAEVPAALQERLSAAVEFRSWSLPDPSAGQLTQAAQLLGTVHGRGPASRGSRSDPAPRLSRHYDLSGCFFMRNIWLPGGPVPAQHVSVQTDAGRLAVSYHIDGRKVIALPQPTLDAIHIDAQESDPAHSSRLLHQLGVRSDWMRARMQNHGLAPIHTRSVIYIMRQYLVIVDRFQARDELQHEVMLPLQLGAQVQECRCDQIAPDRLLVYGPGWTTAMLSPDLSLSMASDDGQPHLNAQGRWRQSCVFVTVTGPDAEALRIDSCELQRSPDGQEDRLEVCGQDSQRHWIDTFFLRDNLRQPVHCADYELRSDLVAERRDASGRLLHVIAAGPGDAVWNHAQPLRISPRGHMEC